MLPANSISRPQGAPTCLVDPDGRVLYPRPAEPLDLWKMPYMYANSAHAEALFRASRDAGFTAGVPGGFQIVRKGEDQVLADRRIVWDNDKQPDGLPPAARRWSNSARARARKCASC